MGGLPATVFLRYCHLSADKMIALRVAAPALSVSDEKARAMGTLQRALSRVVSGKGTQDQPTPRSDVAGGVHPICRTGELLPLDTGRAPLAFQFLPPPSPQRGTGFPPACSHQPRDQRWKYQTAQIHSKGLLRMHITTAILAKLLCVPKRDILTTLIHPPRAPQGAILGPRQGSGGEVRYIKLLRSTPKAYLPMPMHSASLAKLLCVPKRDILTTLTNLPRAPQGAILRPRQGSGGEVRNIKLLRSTPKASLPMPMHSASLPKLLCVPKRDELLKLSSFAR